ncbi:potassium transporter 4-like protein [Jimgerdemannia flammicorona]|uniref:Potassium transporter 4-like protein n=1 Tax=Jimgerdemannia flammicorona TaxID=994334 RepID=A0A433B3C5_9FUNG|nr:potassium transporter 4-like protein [Jimgerdemannia flammicorona]
MKPAIVDKIDLEAKNALHQPFYEGKQAVGWATTLSLAFQSIGVIYGDIGTSPLYVFMGIFPDSDNPPSREDVYGALSLIIWSLTIIPLLKYVFIVLRADDNGEGGSFALYSLISRNCDIPICGTRQGDNVTLTSYGTAEIPHTPMDSNLIQRNPLVQRMLLVLVLFGTSLVMSDGLLTPAVSVLSAVEGITVPAPQLARYVIPATCAIMVVLFAGQKLGTGKVAVVFAPVIGLWLMVLFVVGMMNVAQYPGIMKACSPLYAVQYFLRNGKNGISSLGGVILSVTGVEAMFADLGHFSRRSIQLSFVFMVYPSLILAYCGQGARLILDPTLIKSPFFLTIPGTIYWPVLVLATVATIIASQAMISATFSLISQSMALGCFPTVRVVHTSRSVRGQVYIPVVNWILLAAVILVVVVFRNSTNLTPAYGLCVAMVMFITTIFVAIVMRYVWRWNLLVPIMFSCTFGLVDAVFAIVTLRKVDSGGWFPLMVAVGICGMQLVWKWGTDLKYKSELGSKIKLEDLLLDITPPGMPIINNPSDILVSKEVKYDDLHTETALRYRNFRPQILQLRDTNRIVSRLPGLALFYNNDRDVPKTFAHFLYHYPAVQDVVVFVTVRVVAQPYVDEEDRVRVTPIREFDGFYRCVAWYGYMETVEQGPQFVDRVTGVIDQITPRVGANRAKEAVTTYLLGKEMLFAKNGSGWLRTLMLESFYAFLENNAATAGWLVPRNETIVVGMNVAV